MSGLPHPARPKKIRTETQQDSLVPVPRAVEPAQHRQQHAHGDDDDLQVVLRQNASHLVVCNGCQANQPRDDQRIDLEAHNVAEVDGEAVKTVGKEALHHLGLEEAGVDPGPWSFPPGQPHLQCGDRNG